MKIVKWVLVGFLGLCCCGTWAQADAAGELYNKGVTQLNNGQFDDAAKSFQTIITSYPTFQNIDDTHIDAGQAYLNAKRYAEAIAALDKEAGPNAKPEYRAQGLFLTAQAQFYSAQKNSTAGSTDTFGYSKSATTLTTLLSFIAAHATKDNNDYLEQAYYYRALANYLVNHYDEAEADLKTLTTDSRFTASLTRPEYFVQLGAIYSAQTNDAVQAKKTPDEVNALAAKAVGAFDQVINDPNALVLANEASSYKAGVYMLLAVFESSDDSYRKALDAYRQVRRKADVVKAQTDRLAQLRARAGQLAQAGNASKQLELVITREQQKLEELQQDPDPVIAALIGIANCYINLNGPDGRKQSDEARTILHRLLAHAPLTPDQQKQVDYDVLLSYVLGGQTDKADAKLTEYLSKHAGDPNADAISAQIAQELFKRKDYTGALAAANRSLHDFPKGKAAAQAVTLKAEALTALGRIAESSQVVDDFLTANPTSPEAFALLLSRAANETSANQLDAALADYGKVKDATGATAEIRAGAAAGYVQTLQKLRKYDDVVAEAKKFEAAYPDSKALGAVMFFAAQALDQKGDPGAAAAYQEIARKFPQDPQITPVALYFVVDLYRRANNVPLMLQAAKDLQTACPQAYPQIILADDAVVAALEKQRKFDDAAALYQLLTQAADPAVAADAQNKVGDVRLAQAHVYHYQSLPPDQRPAAEKVLDSAGDAYVGTLKNAPTQLNAVGTALEGLVNVAKLRRSWGLLKEDADVDAYLTQLGGTLPAELQGRVEMAKASLVFTARNGAAQFPAALDRYKKVMAANPDLKLTRQEADDFGQLLLAANDTAGAKKVYQDLLDNAAPNDYVTIGAGYYGLGAAAQAEGNLTAAKDYFLKLKALPGGGLWSKHIIEANFGIALADEKSGSDADLTEAATYYAAIMKAPLAGAVLQTKALLGYGRILDHQGFTLKPKGGVPNEFAVHYFQQPNLMFFTATPQQSAEGLYLAGQAYAKAGDAANAKKAYDTLITTYATAAPDWVAKAKSAEGQ